MVLLAISFSDDLLVDIDSDELGLMIVSANVSISSFNPNNFFIGLFHRLHHRHSSYLGDKWVVSCEVIVEDPKIIANLRSSSGFY